MNAIARLRRERPRSRFARFTVIALVSLVAFAWLGGDFDAGAMFTERSRNNLERFAASAATTQMNICTGITFIPQRKYTR